MILYVPTQAEGQALLIRPSLFRGFPVCDGALPPPFVFEGATAPGATPWLMPRLFYDEATAQIVGAGGFKSAPTDNRIEFGYNVAPSFQRRGFATEGVRQLLREAFSHPEISEVFARVLPVNLPSRRILEKAGFVTRGTVTCDDGVYDIWVLPRSA